MQRSAHLRLGASLLLLSGALASCGSLPDLPKIFPPTTYEMTFDASANAPQAQLQPSADGWWVSYRVNDGATRKLTAASRAVSLDDSCPGNNVVHYDAYVGNKVVLEKKQYTFVLPTQDAFTANAQPATVSIAPGEQKIVQIMLAERVPSTCAPHFAADTLAGLSLGPNSVKSSNGQRVLEIPVSASGAGDYTLKGTVSIGDARVPISIPVKVVKPPTTPAPEVTAVSLTPADVRVRVGDTAKLNAQVTGQGAFDPGVRFTVDKPDVVQVAADGTLTALASGSAVVTATAKGDASKTAKANVTVAAKLSFTVGATPNVLDVTAGSEGNVTLNLGNANGYTGQAQLSATGAPAGLSLSFDPASVTATGSAKLRVQATNVNPGTYPVTVQAKDGTYTSSTTVTVTVKASPTPPPPPPPVDRAPVISSTNLAALSPVTADSATVRASVQDDKGVQSVQLFVNGTAAATFALQGNEYVATWNTSALATGSYGAEIVATDTAGQTARVQGAVRVERPTSGPLQRVRSFDLPSFPTSNLAFDASGQYAFVAAGSSLVRIDVKGGGQATLDLADGGGKSLVVHDGRLYVVTGGNTVTVVDVAAWAVRTSYDLPGMPLTPIVSSAAGLLVGTDAGIARVGANGVLRLGSGRISSLVGGSLAYASTGSSVSMIDATGAIAGQSPISSLGLFMAASNRAYVGTRDGSGLASLAVGGLGTSPVSFRKEMFGQVSGVVEHASGLVATDRGGAITSQSGGQIELDNPVRFATATRGDVIYVGTDNGTLYAVQVSSSGNLTVAAKATGLGKLNANLVLGADGLLYYTSLAGKIIVFKP